jgi:hypothetical protein
MPDPGYDYIGLDFDVRRTRPKQQPTPSPIPDIPANSRVYGLLDRLCEEQGIPSPSELPRMIEQQHQGAIAVGQAFPQLAQLDVQLTQLEENENLLDSLESWKTKIGQRLNQKQKRIQRKKLINKIFSSPYFWGVVAVLGFVGVGYAIGSNRSGNGHQPTGSTSLPVEQPVSTSGN